MSQLDIRMGTLVPCNRANPEDYIRQISAHGFESYQLFFWQFVGDVDFRKLAKKVEAALDEAETEVRPVISSIGIFGNPLEDKQNAKDWRRCIDACRWFGPDCSVVAGFAGCITDRPVPESMRQYKKVFTPLAKRAEDKGVRIAFENCDMGGSWHAARWNIAHAPAAWEMMFGEIESEAIGLEWEPCHQMNSLIDPLPQLRQWVDRVYHIHGKDATVLWDVVKTRGTRGGAPYVFHRTPGFGDTNWTDVISILRQGGFKGAIDIEGWHDPVYRGDLEMTGQVHGLNYLKQCRGGPFVPNPV
ncbi:MAG: sugar phosphate isomerase/epimerase family protein [Planctomycetota bacterium]|nr:sugar phosphate isomerase/epimerase family protein [Planctomycetota bacterium]